MSIIVKCDAKGCGTTYEHPQSSGQALNALPPGWVCVEKNEVLPPPPAVVESAIQIPIFKQESDGSTGAAVIHLPSSVFGSQGQLYQTHRTVRFVLCPKHHMPEVEPDLEDLEDGLLGLGDLGSPSGSGLG